MAIHSDLKYASIDELLLDPNNPRLGRQYIGQQLSQDEILKIVGDWTLDELAYSYLENGGFWPHEALLVVREQVYGNEHLVVVEGNRRLAALRFLHDAYYGQPASQKWRQLATSKPHPSDLFIRIPYLLVDSREEIQSFLGFRHVTGIKQWDADEKAYFIAKLIEEQGMDYQQVRKRVGSTAPAVRKHYVAYRVLLQIETTVDDFDPTFGEDRFTVLYMTLDTKGAQTFLDINIEAPPESMLYPVPENKLQNLADFALWLFGNSQKPPLITDTRQVSEFGKVLSSEEAIQYLRSSPRPSLEYAYELAGGDEDEVFRHIQLAASSVEQALSRAHLFRESLKIQRQVARLAIGVNQLTNLFPIANE